MKGHKRGRLEVRDILPGWSVHDQKYLEPRATSLGPRANERVDYSVELTIGRHGDSEESRFTIQVVTPESLAERPAAPDGTITDRATLVVSQLDRDAVTDHLASLVDSCEAETLDASVPLLQRYFVWEFEGFRKATDVHPLELQEITGQDDRAFRSLCPWDNSEVDYAVRMLVGRPGESEQVSLKLRIVTPEALAQLAGPEFRVLADRATLVVAQFDWRNALAHIEATLANCQAERFHESAWLLQRYFRGEP
jgi:hypothetical protein